MTTEQTVLEEDPTGTMAALPRQMRSVRVMSLPDVSARFTPPTDEERDPDALIVLNYETFMDVIRELAGSQVGPMRAYAEKLQSAVAADGPARMQQALEQARTHAIEVLSLPSVDIGDTSPLDPALRPNEGPSLMGTGSGVGGQIAEMQRRAQMEAQIQRRAADASAQADEVEKVNSESNAPGSRPEQGSNEGGKDRGPSPVPEPSPEQPSQVAPPEHPSKDPPHGQPASPTPFTKPDKPSNNEEGRQL